MRNDFDGMQYHKQHRLFILLYAAIIITAVFTLYQLATRYMEEKNDARIQEMVNATVLGIKPDAVKPLPLVTPDGIPVDGAAVPIEENSEAAENTDDKQDMSDTPGEAPAPFESNAVLMLREVFQNDDIVALLHIDGTSINHVVVQAADNEYYLRRGVNREKSNAGTLFMDYECDARMFSRNTVIYGHNMRNGTMFHELRLFEEPEFFDAHRFISLTTDEGDTLWETFAFYTTRTNFNYIQTVFPDDMSFLTLLSGIAERSVYNTGTDVGVNDMILTLSTCASALQQTRYVLHAKLVSPVS